MTITFEALLNAYWLRPETALWRELDIRAMKSFGFTSHSLDIGCGDGIFSFIRAGGRFDPKFDAFRSTTALDKYFNNVDVYDAFDGRVNPVVVEPPKYCIDYGFDHKKNLLKKARQLGFYLTLEQGDASQRLPFHNGSFNAIFSNIVYWLNDPQHALVETSRILRPGGRACLMLPNTTLPEFSFYNRLYVQTGDPKWAFLEKLDRGRFSDNIRHARSRSAWESMFRIAGLRVVEHQPHLSKTIVQLWDIGLRPIFPVLCRMVEAITPDRFLDIKREWVATMRQFLEPLVDIDASLYQGEEPAFHCYIVEK